MNDDPELQALSAVVAALQGLDREAQERVLAYVSRKLGIAQASDFAAIHSRERVADPNGNEPEASQSFSDQDNLDGVSPIAKKWIRRSGLATEQLGQLFSLGVDEIDVVAKT